MVILKLLRKFFFKILRISHNVRKKFQKKLWTAKLKNFAKEYGSQLYVNEKSEFGGSIYIGNNVSFNGIKIRGKGTVRIGNNLRTGEEVMIITQNHKYDDGERLPFDDKYEYKTVNIGDNVWIGNRVTIMGNANIGEGAVLAAGALVAGEVPPLAVVGGVPAKVIKYRNAEHYNDLKARGMWNNPVRKKRF